MTTKTTRLWNFSGLIRELGGPEEVRRIIRARGATPPSGEAIRGWRLRNSIPSEYLMFLLLEALQLGIVTDLSKLRK